MSDLIDRKTVFDVIDKCILEKLEGDTVEFKEPLKLITKIYRMPSAQSERKKGKWEILYPNHTYKYHCSECGANHKYRFDFCPSCGAYMGDENDE